MRNVALTAFILMLPAAVWADPPKLAASVNVDGKDLALNGTGLRQATVFNVNVYLAGLYLEKKSGSADEIIKSEQSKRLVMHFVRDVEKDDLVSAFDEGFKKQGVAAGTLPDRIKRFEGFMADVKENDEIVMTYVPEKGTSVTVVGKNAGTIVGADFAQALLTIYLGPNPPNASLKKGLLGAPK
ncbi:MAG: chalcone isomerase family protein [Deltaproteobacteria bacterium]|nr:chalcone isomerase family protein [Deltaproteobacteria bacterium]